MLQRYLGHMRLETIMIYVNLNDQIGLDAYVNPNDLRKKRELANLLVVYMHQESRLRFNNNPSSDSARGIMYYIFYKEFNRIMKRRTSSKWFSFC